MATNKGAELLESLKTQGLSQQEMLNRWTRLLMPKAPGQKESEIEN